MLVALGMPQSGTDTCQKFSGAKWFGQIVISTQIKGCDLAFFQGSGRDNDNRCNASGADLLDQL